MATDLDEIPVSLISKGLFKVVNDVVGHECIVKLRRQRFEIYDAFSNCKPNIQNYRITSGSRAEGFQFESSDFDYMHVNMRTTVLTRSTLSAIIGTKDQTLLLMETDAVSPGFAFIRCLTCNPKNNIIFNYLVMKGSFAYVSGRLVREKALSSKTSRTHGPCQTDFIYGKETDRAFTLSCPFWPKEATGFVRRSIYQGWPSYDVLADICKDGCLFVPINSKQQYSRDMLDLEWRISFSLAEKKLVSCMNHCQFLCYGLAKLFLNEILKMIPSLEDLLCSYFMKTALFWEISERPQEWTIGNLLSKFWNVFRRLINWCNEGYCPNFFIPENNMFLGKIFGEKKRILLSELLDLYSDGYLCLLRCSSLNANLTEIITQPDIDHTLSCNEEECVSMSDIIKGKLQAILNFATSVFAKDAKDVLTILNKTVNLNIESEEMMLAKRLRINYMFQKYADFLSGFVGPLCPSYPINRKKYTTMKRAKVIVRKTKTFLCMDNLIYAKCSYMAGNYHKAIEILDFIKQKLQSQPYIILWFLDDDIIMRIIRRRQQGMSYDTFIKSFVMGIVKMFSQTTIEELQLESRLNIDQRGGERFISIDPLVFIHFILILSYTRLGYISRRCHILKELHTLVHSDDKPGIHKYFKAISWQILGICQQLCGDRLSAFQSYMNALNHEHNYFKRATKARIHSLFY